MNQYRTILRHRHRRLLLMGSMFLLAIVLSINSRWLYTSLPVTSYPLGNTQEFRRETKKLDSNILQEPLLLPGQTQGLHIFSVYIYNADELVGIHKNLGMFIHKETTDALSILDHATRDPQSADAFVVLLSSQRKTSQSDCVLMRDLLGRLPHWNGGRNHVIVNLVSNQHNQDLRHCHPGGNIMVAQPTFQHVNFRNKFDLIIPIAASGLKTQCTEVVQLTSAKPRHLVSFWGELDSESQAIHGSTSSLWNQLCGTAAVHGVANIDINCSCQGNQKSGLASEWQLCSSEGERRQKLTNSTFTVIPSPRDGSFLSTSTFQARFYEALQAGSIPVVLGTGGLPFEEILNWKDAVVFLANIKSESIRDHLRLYSEQDIFKMRRKGRIFWKTYLCKNTLLLETVLLLIRMRNSEFLSLPAEQTRTRYNGSMYVLSARDKIRRGALPRRIHHHNSDLQLPVDPFHYYPSTPFQSSWATEIFHRDPRASVLADKKIQQGSNFLPENVTVVMIMFNRLGTLPTHVNRLKNLAFIERILIVWDAHQPLTDEQTRLDSNGKLKFIHVGRDSLNNRFLPFDLIETEAVLLLDDDMMPSKDFLFSGFRLWRQNRERIVGLVARTALWKNQSWEYYQHSMWHYAMVLTPVMFIHKYYLYLYTSYMPAAIRRKVDELMNCEDIAMNFLVAHITRKPALKIGSMLTAPCVGPGCSNKAISKRPGHYGRRTGCMEYFTKLYGYMPLVFSQSTMTTWEGGKGPKCPK